MINLDLNKLAKSVYRILDDLKVPQKSELKKSPERYTEDLFSKIFSIREIPLTASRVDVPSIKASTGTWKPDGSVSGADGKIFEVFEFKKPSVSLCEGKVPVGLVGQYYYQAIRYIAGSHFFPCEKPINRIFCFNSKDIVLVQPFTKEHLDIFLSKPIWKECVHLGDKEMEEYFKSKRELIEAYFKLEHIARLPDLENESSKEFFKHQIQNFCESLLRTLGVESVFARSLITNKNLKGVYEQFAQVVQYKPEEHFIKIAPVWTRTNLFFYGRNGFLHIFQKGGLKVTDIPKVDIRGEDLGAVEKLLGNYVLDNPETFYDNYDTLLDKKKRKQLGSYFTKKGLAGFAQYFIAHHVDDISSHYIVDPAAGSGTLLAGIKAKSVFGTDIHEFKYSLMRERGVKHFHKPVDFLTTAPFEYVNQLNEVTLGDALKNPLLIFSNPPYLGHSSPDNLEQSLRSIIKNSSINSHDLCSYFMIQMTRLFDATDNGTGEELDGYIATFSPTTWINEERGEQTEFRKYMLSKFSYVKGFKVDGSKFFDNMSQPVLFSLLKRRKKVTWNEKDLVVPTSLILDLTKEHKLVSDIGYSWMRMPDLVKSRIVPMSDFIDESATKLFNDSVDYAFDQKQDSRLGTFLSDLPRFSGVLKTSSSQTGDNDQSLSSKLVKRSSDVSDAVEEFRHKLRLRLSPKDIAAKMRLVFDDRSSFETGYRFVYCDKTKFNRQAILNSEGPLLNYFEEVKKSVRKAKFYNLPPITTDIAVAEVAFQKVSFSATTEFNAVGFKKINPNTREARYLLGLMEILGDARALIFMRAFLSMLEDFKKITKNKAIDSELLWLPSLAKNNGEQIRKFAFVSFCHSISTTKFDQLDVSALGQVWCAVDFFNPDGWLKQAGLMNELYAKLAKDLPKNIVKVGRAAVERRRERKFTLENDLQQIGEDIFEELFLPLQKAA